MFLPLIFLAAGFFSAYIGVYNIGEASHRLKSIGFCILGFCLLTGGALLGFWHLVMAPTGQYGT